MESNDSVDDGTKKGPFDNFDRGELIKKCKNLLTIAKNAKQAKDEYHNENTKLKETIKTLESDKIADKNHLSAMQEIVDNLTDKELATTTKIDQLQQSLNAANEQIQTSVNQSIENESMKRQIKRLTDENDELMKDLENAEKQLQTVKEASIEQNKDLRLLEETATKWAKLEMEYNKLNEKYKQTSMEKDTLKKELTEKAVKEKDEQLIQELDNIKCELEQKQEIIKNYEQLNEEALQTSDELKKMRIELNDKIKQCQRFEEQLEKEAKSTKTTMLEKQLKNQAKKLSLYKTKILEFSAKLKQLRLCKEILSKTVTEYSLDVSKWQIEIVQVSNKLFEKIHILQSEKTDAIELIAKLKEENANLIQHSNDFEAQCNSERADKCKSLEKFKEIELNYNILQQQHEILQKEIENTNNSIEQSNQETQCEDLKSENLELNEKLLKVLKENEELNENLGQFKEKLSESQEKSDKHLAALEAIQQQLQENQNELQTKNEEMNSNLSIINRLKDSLKQMDANTNQLNAKVLELENLLSESERKIANVKSSNADILQKKAVETEELLNEMRELNEALKNRGDVISKQTNKIAEMETETAKSKKRLVELETNFNEKNMEIIRLTGILSDFERASVVNETFSTSSLSKTEETARLRDIEDSFEDKYNKLRSLAVKLKKKVTEQSAIIAKLESKNNQNSDDGTQINTKLGAIEIQVKNLQLLQSENDKLQDRIETLIAENKNGEKHINELKEEIKLLTTTLTELKDDQTDSKTMVAETKKSKLSLEQAIKEYVKQIQSLKNECNNNSLIRKDLETELSKFKDESATKDKEIHALKDDENKLKQELTKVKSSMKNKNVLDLEMEAYEKSLKEISQKLEDKNTQISELQLTIKSNESTNDALRNQIKILEDSLESEKNHSIDLKQQIDIDQCKLKESEHEKLDLTTKYENSIKINDQIKIELETVRLNAEQSTIDREKIVQLLQSENERNIREICSMTDEISTLKTKLKETEEELVNLKTEYTSYKVRVQLVLRQNQSSETSREKELDDELVNLRSYLETTQTKLNTICEQKDQLCSDLEESKQDKERIQLRCKELLELLDESRSQIEVMHSDIQKQSAEHQEVLKAQRLQIETLNNCYRKQIAEMEEKQKKECEEMKSKQISEIHSASIKASQSVANIVDLNRNPALFKPLTSDEQKIDWILTERQEGEGSENTTISSYALQRKISTSSRSRRDFIPLDELLSNSFEDNASMLDVSISPTIELQATKDKLNLQESRVKHLTVILAEAEQDLARLTQLNDVLKEEMRRNERSTEREQHLHNLEYLKNVVFKFLTINNGDEKLHLVPVLNTILKLSPEETHKLQSCAKGDNQSRNWGNYLPLWSNNS